jgi:hypothetical protein
LAIWSVPAGLRRHRFRQHSNRLLTEEILSGGNLSALDELFDIGGFTSGRVYLDASSTVH